MEVFLIQTSRTENHEAGEVNVSQKLASSDEAVEGEVWLFITGSYKLGKDPMEERQTPA